MLFCQYSFEICIGSNEKGQMTSDKELIFVLYLYILFEYFIQIKLA